MCDDEGGAPVHEGVHASLHHLLCACINARGGLVEDKGRWIGDGCPRNSKQLALTLAEVATIATDDSEVTI